MAKLAIVDENDVIIGAQDKIEAYSSGSMHRVIRVFLFNEDGELLIQKRSVHKDFFPNRWDQSVGGHVDEGEDYVTAAKREAKEELGIDIEHFEDISKVYIQYELHPYYIKRFDMLFSAQYNGSPIAIHKEEVTEVKWVALEDLRIMMLKNPDDFTPDFIEALQRYKYYTTPQDEE